MSFRKRNPYMTINHGLIGAKKGHGENRFLVIFAFSEYALVSTKYFAFNSYEELQDSGQYNWFNLLYTWITATDQIQMIENKAGVGPSDRLRIDDWDINFQETTEIRRDYDRDRRRYVLKGTKNHDGQKVKENILGGAYSIPLYDDKSITGALQDDCKTPKMIMDMVNFDLNNWLETPKKPDNMKSFYTNNGINTYADKMNIWSLSYVDLSSSYVVTDGRAKSILDVFEIEAPLYNEFQNYEDDYADIRACITNNEILLKTGTSNDDTFAYSITIKKL